MTTATPQRLTAILYREDEVYVAKCPEVGTASQGDTIEEALANLRQAPSSTWRNVCNLLWRPGC